ncbi:reverse transcriptase domain-containing protein [Tanacetum coccineum]
MLFLSSIEGAARIWLEKESPHFILTWEDLVSKFINQFFPLSKTTNLRNEITNFQQRFDESFGEAWDRFKDLLRACPHHGFTELHQLDTFYNALTPTDQDSLNVAAVIFALADAVKVMLLQKSSPPASVKAVEEICVTCGGPHPYQQCLATDGNVFPEYRDNIQGYVSASAQTQVAPSNELLNYKKINDANMKAMQNQINNVKNELRNEMQTSIQTSMSNQTNKLKNMIDSFFQMNTASSSGLGSLPSNTLANPRGNLKAITIQSGISYDGPPIPPPLSPLPKVVEREPETFVPSGVLIRTGLITPVKQNEKRTVHKVSIARPVSTTRHVSTVRPFAPKIAQTNGAIRPIYPRMDNVWRPKGNYLDHVSKDSGSFMLKKGNPEILLQDHVVVDSGCFSHMTGNKAYLLDYEDYNGGFVAFGSDPIGDFHEIIDFLTRSSIYYALIVSPVVSTTFVEQFWMSAKSKIINNVRYITAKVAGKPVTILEASIRSDLLFDDADGIDYMHNQAIFDAIQLMRHLDAKKNFVMYPRFISIFLDKQLKDVPVPLDHFLVPTLTKKRMRVRLQKDHLIPNPYPLLLTQVKTNLRHRLTLLLDLSGGNHGGQSSSDRSLSRNEDGLTLQSVYDLCISLCTQVSAQAKEIKALKAQVKKLKKGVKPLITHHKAWMKSVALKTRLARKTSLKKKGVQKEYVSKQGRKSVKSSKGEPSVHKDPAFDDLDDDAMDYMETEDAQDEGRTSWGGQALWCTDKRNKGTDKQDGGTDSTKVSTDRQGKGTADQNEGKSATQTAPTTTSTPTPTIFDTERPRPTSTRSVLTLKPLPKIDPKDKGKKMIDEEGESDTESDDITEAKKKFKMLAKDEEVARKVQKNGSRRMEKEKTPKKNKGLIEETSKGRKINSKGNLLEQEVNKSRLHKVSSPDGNYLVVYRVNGHFRAFNYLMEVLHIFDRQDLFHLYDLVMKQYSEITPEDIELILWGDLKIMMESSTKENDQGDFWNNQQEWEIVRWRLYEACGVCILELKDGTVIYMLVERRYPLSKELMQRMLDLGLEVEEESTAALQLNYLKEQTLCKLKVKIYSVKRSNIGESINLMPLSIWKKLSLPELTPTQMILELADRSTTSPSGIAKDVFVKVGKFHFLANFIVVDYVVDHRVPLILGRPFLRMANALIDVYGEELTLRVNDEAITFKVSQTLRYSYNDAVLINRIDVIDVACEEYAQEVLGFSDSSTSGNPTPSLDPILSTSSPSLTPFEEGDFILEEIKACLTNDSIPLGIDDADFDPEGDLLLLEKLLNDDPSSPLPPKELHVEELKIVKSSIDDPPELELKDLPSHLEYAFLEGTDKLPVIIAKNLKEDEKVRLLKVLKSHKRAIA